MNSEIPKQFLLLNDLPILMHTLNSFLHFDKRILVLPQSQIDNWNALCTQYSFNTKHTIVAGGINRFGSVKNGLKKVEDESIVAIHDGVRPLISKNLIDKLIAATKKGIGVVPVVPVKDSLRKIEGNNSKAVSRSNLYKVQTPQCFFTSTIKEAYKQNFSLFFTDDASVLENNGGKIITIQGEEKNLKITTEEDLRVAEVLMQ
ncbi:MAG: 2-C-methyl-D-erythritol 4-phosphate cytidylyltransferase [Flavobacteriales bacterium]|nr:2-C-methyl-D-erythritol 4-phosphate cytidylyltransferase [Flavobacteriales bacterium]